ncbi:MAG: NUDIX domain-containing protein [Phycisphaerales bacterium]
MNDQAARWHRCAGGVVLDGRDRVLLIDQTFPSGERQVTLPKGHLEEGESETEAAIREIREETGIVVGPPIARLPRASYVFRHRKGLRRKTVAWFVFQIDGDGDARTIDVAGGENEGIARAWWTSIDEAADAVTHDATRFTIQAARRALGVRAEA